MAYASKNSQNDKVTVSYPVREATQEITVAEANLIRSMENKVQAIRFIMQQYDLGLYEAKNLVDTVMHTYRD